MINSFTDDRRFLSNFYPSQIEHMGYIFPTVENFYQSMKVSDPTDRVLFTGVTPNVAKRRGQQVTLRRDWESIKLEVMALGVMLKFAPGSGLAADLLSTGDEYLEEGNTWGDRFWGAVNGSGENWLGLILMRRRAQLRRLEGTT